MEPRIQYARTEDGVSIGAKAQGDEILVSSLLEEVTESAAGIAFGKGREVELKRPIGKHRILEVAWR